MKTVLMVLSLAALFFIGGCGPVGGSKELLTVNFNEGQTLRYKFVSTRDILVNWGAMGKKKRGEEKIDKSSESITMIVAYNPVEVDPYGLTTIKATCESVKAKHHHSKGKQKSRADAVESLTGKSFTFTVDALGRIEDKSQLEKLIKEAGKKAFRPRSKGGTVKEPDTIGDFVATQWFLWDSISSIGMKQSLEGISVGQEWNSSLPVPASIVWKKARAVNYRLEEFRNSQAGRIAVISSTYSPLAQAPKDWPLPYSGSFQMSGVFGLLRGYKILDLKGAGEELFNIDAGRCEEYTQNYTVEVQASFPFGITEKLKITIEQTITMQLLQD